MKGFCNVHILHRSAIRNTQFDCLWTGSAEESGSYTNKQEAEERKKWEDEPLNLLAVTVTSVWVGRLVFSSSSNFYWTHLFRWPLITTEWIQSNLCWCKSWIRSWMTAIRLNHQTAFAEKETQENTRKSLKVPCWCRLNLIFKGAEATAGSKNCTCVNTSIYIYINSTSFNV